MNRPQPKPSEPQEPYDAGNPRDVDRRTKEAALRAAKMVEGLKAQLSSESGRAILAETLKATGFTQENFDGTSRTYYNLGAGKMGWLLFKQSWKHAQAETILMINEHDLFA